MKLLKVLQLCFIFKIVSAAEYLVTIMNDSEILDGQGAVHTWLKIDGSNQPTKYFSFENDRCKYRKVI